MDLQETEIYKSLWMKSGCLGKVEGKGSWRESVECSSCERLSIKTRTGAPSVDSG